MESVLLYRKDYETLAHQRNTYMLGLMNAANMMGVFKDALKERCTPEEYHEIEQYALSVRANKL